MCGSLCSQSARLVEHAGLGVKLEVGGGVGSGRLGGEVELFEFGRHALATEGEWARGYMMQ